MIRHQALTETPPIHIHLEDFHIDEPRRKTYNMLVQYSKYSTVHEISENGNTGQITVSLLVIIIIVPVSSNGGRPALPHICRSPKTEYLSKT